MTAGKTQSEGGFAPDRVANVALLNTAVVEDKKGKKYYDYELLSRSGASLFDNNNRRPHTLNSICLQPTRSLIIGRGVPDFRPQNCDMPACKGFGVQCYYSTSPRYCQ